MTQPALHAFFAGLIDYAGLYPPAALSMDRALRECAEARNGADGWVLNRLVVPASRLEEFGAGLAGLPPALRGSTPWRVTVTAGGDITDCASRIGEFAAHQALALARIETVETVARTPEQVGRARDAIPPAVGLVLELPLDGDLPALARAVRSTGSLAKVRTGGVRAGEIPAGAAVLAFLTACAAERLAFKATAGLHHAVRGPAPLTYERAAERATMLGYLNVVLAATAVWSGRSAADALRILEDEDRAAFQPGGDVIRWRELRFPAEEIGRARAAFVTAIGSCSFAEPLEEIRQLGVQLAGPA
jgi:hypothetical protein